MLELKLRAKTNIRASALTLLRNCGRGGGRRGAQLKLARRDKNRTAEREGGRAGEGGEEG